MIHQWKKINQPEAYFDQRYIRSQSLFEKRQGILQVFDFWHYWYKYTFWVFFIKTYVTKCQWVESIINNLKRFWCLLKQSATFNKWKQKAHTKVWNSLRLFMEFSVIWFNIENVIKRKPKELEGWLWHNE